MEPALLQVMAASAFLVLLTVAGAFAFASRPGWSLIDGLYMTFITVSTIGFQEVHPLTPLGRILTIAIGADRMACVILKPNVDRFLEQALHVGGLDLHDRGGQNRVRRLNSTAHPRPAIVARHNCDYLGVEDQIGLRTRL